MGRVFNGGTASTTAPIIGTADGGDAQGSGTGVRRVMNGGSEIQFQDVAWATLAPTLVPTDELTQAVSFNKIFAHQSRVLLGNYAASALFGVGAPWEVTRWHTDTPGFLMDGNILRQTGDAGADVTVRMATTQRLTEVVKTIPDADEGSSLTVGVVDPSTWTQLPSSVTVTAPSIPVRDLTTVTETTTTSNNYQLAYTTDEGSGWSVTSWSTPTSGFTVDGTILRQTGTAGATVSVVATTSIQPDTVTKVVPAAGVVVEVISTTPAVGSLRKHVQDRMTTAALSQTVSDSTKARFSVQDHSGVIYTPNPNGWAKDFDFSCESPWNSVDGVHRAGTLVAPDSFIAANHYPIPAGTTLRFVSATGTVYERTSTHGERVGETDLWLGRLDSPLPSDIKFAKVLPTSYSDKMPTDSGIFSPTFPSFEMDQEEKILAVGLLIDAANTVLASAPTSTLQAWNETIIVGDSGNPVLIPVYDEMVLLMTFLGPGAGPSVRHNAALINAAMTSQGSPYQLTVVDLSSFTSF